MPLDQSVAKDLAESLPPESVAALARICLESLQSRDPALYRSLLEEQE